MTTRSNRFSLLVMILTVLAVPSLGLTASETAEKVREALEKPLSAAFGRDMPGKIVYEGNQSVAQVVGIDYPLGSDGLNDNWGEKVVKALEAAGAENAEITTKDSWGPTEVRAENLKVGEKTMMSIQFTPDRENQSIGVVLMYVEM